MIRSARFAVLYFALAALVGTGVAVEEAMLAEKPVGVWFFGGSKPQPEFEKAGGVNLNAVGPRAPEFEGFTADNHASAFDGMGARLVVRDSGAESPFDFKTGEAITIEVWVRPEAVGDGANVYLIGKGRTWPGGMKLENQHWAMRLLGKSDAAHLTFLFQTTGAGGKARNHRWVSEETLGAVGSWHHVAVSYRFGNPETIAGFIDGRATGGAWDYDGATRETPAANDEPVWIGSSMGGKPENSLRGRLDAVAVYRSIVPPDDLKARWQAKPVKDEAPVFVAPPRLDRVLVEIRPGAGEQKRWPGSAPAVTETYETAAFAFTRPPVAYDESGIRSDRTPAVMLRGYAAVDIPAGKHRILLRGRGATRLWVNGSVIAGTRFAVFRGDGHSPVEPIPEPPALGVRRLPFGDGETIAEFTSTGGRHELVFDVLAGSKSMRAETGESLAAIQFNGAGPFYILGPSGRRVPLTDAAWPAFAAECEAALTEQDTQRRRSLAASGAEYWRRRHADARSAAAAIAVPTPESSGATAIDRFILAKVESANANGGAAPAGAVSFARDIKPVLTERCFRCHGEKRKGGLRLDTREAALRPGESGSEAVIPGHPERSHLLSMVRSTDEEKQMPPTGARLTAEQIRLLEKWIKEGASWDDTPAGPITIPPDAGDAAFLRRVYLSAIGIAPGAEETRTFLDDKSPDKRGRLIDRLLDNPRFADHWVSYWQDVLAENPNILKPELNNSGPFRFWIHESLLDNKPLDRFVTELILMRGSKLGGGPAGFGMASQNDVPLAEKANIIANAFLGVEMKCARCHDAPYHQSTQRQLFQMAAMLQERPLKIPATSSVPAAFFEKTKSRQPLIKATVVAGSVIEGEWPFDGLCTTPAPTDGTARSPREQLAWAITGPHNRRFAEVIANRVWQRLFGMGIVHPVHDWEGRSPSHPALLAWLGRELMTNGYDLRHLCRVIMRSAAWQRRAVENPAASDPARRFFTAPLPRRMSAEQIVDTLHAAIGRPIDTEPLTFDIDSSQKPENMLNLGVPRRAWEFTSLANERDRPALALPRAQTVTDMLEAFGWRPSRPEPLTDRPSECTALQPAMLANGTLAAGLATLCDDSRITAMACQNQPLSSLIENIWLHLLNRTPTASEQKEAAAMLTDGYETRLTGLPAAAPTNEDADLTYSRISWSNHLRPEATEIKQRITRAILRGPNPTARLAPVWRERCEDLIWSLINSAEFLAVP